MLSKQDEMKKAVAEAALEYVVEGAIVGVGTGSTANFFIDGLAQMKDKILGAVASSEASAQRLQSHGIPLFDLNEVSDIPVYVDGADEVDSQLAMMKGGGGALTREKIVAAVAQSFVCIVDESKLVESLGKFPLPVEVIPMAREQVCRALNLLENNSVAVKAILREGFTTDNGNIIIDVHGLIVKDAKALEVEINNITGVVCNGVFARPGADVLLVASSTGVKTQLAS